LEEEGEVGIKEAQIAIEVITTSTLRGTRKKIRCSSSQKISSFHFEIKTNNQVMLTRDKIDECAEANKLTLSLARES
jgi:hypothetical protein